MDQLEYDVIVIGGGQAALAVGYYLRRLQIRYLLLDDKASAGGAWLVGWKSLRLFSPSQWSSLPGFLMPRGEAEYPTRNEVLSYLHAYEQRYQIPIQRGVVVRSVGRHGDVLRVVTDHGVLQTRAVVSATGGRPHFPVADGRAVFSGRQIHSQQYSSPDAFQIFLQGRLCDSRPSRRLCCQSRP